MNELRNGVQQQKPKNIREYICNLNAVTIDKLYVKSSANCLAVFRELPLLAKHYVMRLMFVEQTIPQEVVSGWIKGDCLSEHKEVATVLSSLRIWNESPMPGGLPGYIMSDVFRKNLKTALLGGGENWMINFTSDKDKHERDAAFLDNYSMERWECILQFMVGNETETISQDTIKTLIKAELIEYDLANTSQAPKITSMGFQFLLMNTRDQVWYFTLHYLDMVEMNGFCFVDCLSFLLQLSFSTLGKDYSMDGLKESLLPFLQNLREFGLIYQRKRKDRRFYPTKLVINLTNYVPEEALNEKSVNKQEEGFLIVETNYRVYAYTDSPLKIALLALFVELKYRFPKFCLGYLTRDSVRRALRNGITAEQIINFLNINCHPDMGKNGGKRQVPPTVMDQIRLWEIERDRFVFLEGSLYNQFLSQKDFELLRDYARDSGYLIWENSAKRLMVVCNRGHDEVRRFWKRHKKEH